MQFSNTSFSVKSNTIKPVIRRSTSIPRFFTDSANKKSKIAQKRK